jgi:hypothetical protein
MAAAVDIYIAGLSTSAHDLGESQRNNDWLLATTHNQVALRGPNHQSSQTRFQFATFLDTHT